MDAAHSDFARTELKNAFVTLKMVAKTHVFALKTDQKGVELSG